MKKQIIFLIIAMSIHNKTMISGFWQRSASMPTSVGYGTQHSAELYGQEYKKMVDQHPAMTSFDFRTIPVLHQNEKSNQQGPYLWPTHPTRVTADAVIAWSTVNASEYSGNCGYHALFNVATLLRCLQAGDSQHCTGLLSPAKYVEFMQFAVPAIGMYRLQAGKDVSKLDWLDGFEMEFLYRKLQDPSSGYIQHPAVPFLVIEHVEGMRFPVQVCEAIINLKEQPAAKMGFVWNYGARTELSSAGGVHWTAFVAVKHPRGVILNYMNSIPAVMEASQLELIKSLFQKSPKQLQEIIEQQIAESRESDLALLQQRDAIASASPESKNIFQQYLGYVSFDGPFVQAFTKEMLSRAPGLEDTHFNDAAIQRLNNNWSKIVARKTPIVLARPKQRYYGIWINLVTGALQAYEEDLAVLLMHAHDGLLASENNDLSFFELPQV